MKLPAIEGIIRRRILVNYRAGAEAIQPLLPPRFRPKLHQGYAVAGICLIRLDHIRPRRLPGAIGVSSENAAHRIAVLWDDENGEVKEGVFVPRRDTNSQMNHLLGGRIFPGRQHKAEFKVDDSETSISLAMKSRDGEVSVEVSGRLADALPQSSIFQSLSEASSFFESGSLGYSTTDDAGRLDGMLLDVKEWRVEALEVEKVYSSFFADQSRFPEGSVEFDHALIMRNVEHEWRKASDLHV